VTTLLSIEHVTRTFATGGLLGRIQFAAIDDISFSLESARPEIFAIIGESGSGKTTLARMILNTLTPSQGIIRFLGEDISRFRGRRNRLRFMQKVQPIF
jgi:ABC-type oligopeptide transport system ATPase subunit